MNKQLFNEAISRKEALLKVSENELREICSEFPYFSLARTLLTGHYFLKDHFQFENSLKIAASQVNSRISIKNYMNSLIRDKADNELASDSVVAIKETPPTESSEIEASTALKDEAKTDIANSAPSKIQLPDSDSINPGPAGEIKNNTPKPSNELRFAEEPPQDTQKESKEASEPTYISRGNPVISPVGLPGNKTTPHTKKQKPDFREHKKQHSEFISNGIKPYQRKKSREELLAVINKRLEQIKKEKRHSKSGRTIKTTYPGYSIDDLAEKATPQANETSSPLNKKLELIDRFIEQDPSISKPKQEFFQTDKQSERSGQFADEVISETLANILAKQGHLEKAVEMYQKLILKFPEKSSYFAALIKKIKNS